MNKYYFFGWFFVGLTLFMAANDQAQTTFTVTNTDDSGPGSFRQAMSDVTSSTEIGSFTITVSSGSGGNHDPVGG